MKPADGVGSFGRRMHFTNYHPVIAAVTRWLICNGRINLDGFRDATLLVAASWWAVAVLGSILALGLFHSNGSRYPAIASVLAFAASAIGYLGFFAAPPWWPQVGYCHTDGNGVFAFDLNSLFSVPVILGVTAFLAGISGKVTCPDCRQPGIPLRDIWLGSVRSPHRCSECSATCRLNNFLGFWFAGVISSFAILGLGYLAAGRAGALILLPTVIPFAAWLHHRMIRRLGLLTSSARSCPEG
jgi:hypothetical protein